MPSEAITKIAIEAIAAGFISHCLPMDINIKFNDENINVGLTDYQVNNGKCGHDSMFELMRVYLKRYGVSDEIKKMYRSNKQGALVHKLTIKASELCDNNPKFKQSYFYDGSKSYHIYVTDRATNKVYRIFIADKLENMTSIEPLIKFLKKNTKT